MIEAIEIKTKLVYVFFFKLVHVIRPFKMFPIETSWVIRGQAHLGQKIWQMNQVPRANALIK